MKRSQFLLLFSLLSLTAVSSVQAETKQKYVIRWAVVHEPARVFERGIRHFSEVVKRETDGHIQVELVGPKVVGLRGPLSPTAAFNMIKKGQVEMIQTYTTYLANHNPALLALDLPFIFKDHNHSRRVLDGPIGKKMLAPLDQENVRGLAFTYSGGFMILPTQDQEIHTIEDLKGLRVKVNLQSPVGMALMKSVGAVPIETEDEGSRRIKALETTYARFKDLKPELQKSKNVINDLQHSLFLTAILINKEFFERLPKNYQAAIQKAALEAAELERQDSIKDSELARQEYLKSGHKIVTMDGAELQKFKKVALDVHKQFEPIIGKDLIEAIKAN